MTLSIDLPTFDRWLQDGDELAVLDLRDEAVAGYGEPLGGANVPLPRLEARIDDLLPRRDARTVLVDADGRVAPAAAVRLRELVFGAVHALDGGIDAWVVSGRTTVFNRLGKLWTADLAREHGTPSVEAGDLRRLQDRGVELAVIDVRTAEEFERGHVPGAISVPGGELLYRFADLVPSPQARVVVSCAGLPRAVLGAQTLIDAGVPNPVAVLHDGTQGWTRVGGTLETGVPRRYADASDAARTAGRRLAERLAASDPVPEATAADIAAWRADPARTTYLLDVRTAEEYRAGHLPGAVHAPGGQAVTVPQRFVAVRGARLVLVDDDGTRATQIGHWLRQRGWAVWRHATGQPQTAAATRTAVAA